MKLRLYAASLLLTTAAAGQYATIPSSSYPALDAILNAKPAFTSGAGAPAGSCTAGKDLYLDTTGTILYFCSATNTWTAAVTPAGTQTLTNKTLTTPTIASFTNATHTHTNAAGGGQLNITTASNATGTPSSSNYLRGDNTWQTPAGSGTGNAASNVTTTFSATPTFTCGSSSAGTTSLFTLSTALTANITSSTLATCTAGQTLAFHFVQDGTGGRTVTMPTNFDSLTVDPTISTATDAIYAYDGTNGRLLSVNGKSTPFILQAAAERAAPTSSLAYPSGQGAMWFDSTAHAPTFGSNLGATKFVAPLIKASRTANQFVTNVDSTGAQNTAAIAAADLPAALSSSTSVNGTTVPASVTLTQTIASNSTAMGTSSIASGACATVVTATATNTVTTDVLTASFNGDPTAVTGYVPQTSGMLTIIAYPTANTANFKVCNNTAGAITPGAITLNWRVVR